MALEVFPHMQDALFAMVEIQKIGDRLGSWVLLTALKRMGSRKI